ncbi:hypothetical protein L1F30_00715 [Simiduia sp. 21SJ11W-1]|uniref:hypothetical protein n=1 Tax=Simiduia sp. 21SJ11W-1 TaxID=2909669 RepID=UPI0020A0549A|nr:hypothetical protein [Simiduia sp. 21SJ11W-1]UTA48077.1 hypothetical protein L1F30_00715 [Simiduia sp. 21SJ11W-1]
MARAQRECHIGVGYHRTDEMRAKLIREITGFERQLQALQIRSGPVDFSLLQTYKELIAARQTLLKKLPHATQG